MHALIAMIEAHPAAVLAWGSMIALAVFNSMPTPGAKFSFYEWFYDAVHLFLSMRTQRTQQVVVTQGSPAVTAATTTSSAA